MLLLHTKCPAMSTESVMLSLLVRMKPGLAGFIASLPSRDGKQSGLQVSGSGALLL